MNLTEAPAGVRETHSAVVMLLGERAYKFKKPVDLGFLDFRSDEVRRAVCLRELELNRRLAPDVYLDVVTVTGSAGTDYEHGILMRRMPEARRLSTLVRQGAEVKHELRSVARLLAEFHARADRSPAIAAEAGVEGLRRRWLNNLAETEKYRATVLTEPVHSRIGGLALRYLEGRSPLLAERAAAGLAVDGHADLIAEDVFCLPDYPRVLDCIEFDDRLRWVDVLDDAAFLAMDLEHLGRADLAALFLGFYLDFSRTPTVPSLRHHYIGYRAFVRAKVACIQAEQGRPAAVAEARDYAHQALRHLGAGEVTLTLIGGAPGTGKSTLARSLAVCLGHTLLSSDELRRALPELGGERYSVAAKRAAYRELLARAHHALAHGESVIADATWGDLELRESATKVAACTTSRLVVLECRLPPELAARRAQLRLEHREDRSEAGAEVARQLAAQRAPWPEAIGIDTARSPRAVLSRVLELLSAAEPAGARS